MSQTIPTVTTTIANGASLSGSVDTGGRQLVAIETPSTMDGAKFFFEASGDGLTWLPVYDDASTPARVEVGYAASEARHTELGNNADFFRGARYLRLQSMTGAGAAQTQSAQRAIGLVFR